MLRPALKKYSSSVFNQVIYDTALDLSYYPHWINDSLFIQEYALDNNDTIHNLTRKVDAVKFVNVGSEIIGGKGGGGRKDFTQAGGQDQSKIEQAFEKLKTLI